MNIKDEIRKSITEACESDFGQGPEAAKKIIAWFDAVSESTERLDDKSAFDRRIATVLSVIKIEE